jgi:hypothetical protein
LLLPCTRLINSGRRLVRNCPPLFVKVLTGHKWK